jgi:hypothetical protein
LILNWTPIAKSEVGNGHSGEQQRSAAARRKETVTFAGHTRKKIQRKSSALWTTESEKQTFPTSRGHCTNKCCIACQQRSVQTKWTSEEQTLWKVTLTSETRNQCIHSNSDYQWNRSNSSRKTSWGGWMRESSKGQTCRTKARYFVRQRNKNTVSDASSILGD